MNNGIVFGTQGPVMSGTWYNPNTGDSFTVRDSFFENGQYLISTTDGRVLGYDLIQNYVQSDAPIEKQPDKPQVESLPDEVAGLLEDEEGIWGNPITPPIQSLGNLKETVTSPSTPIDEDVMLIRIILRKASAPQVVCDIKWDNFPTKQLEMLDMMAVEPEMIVEYFVRQINLEDIKRVISSKIVEALYPIQPAVEDQIKKLTQKKKINTPSEVRPEQPDTKPTKKTTKKK